MVVEAGTPMLQLLSPGRTTECRRWRDFILAYRTLGVVFGGLVTSPLYVYPSMNLDSPTEDDYLGIYSIMFWTLTLIGVVKYVLIALKADDNGEGGTFALYSLLCRHINIGSHPSRSVSSSTYISHSSHSMNSRTSNLGKFFEESITAKRILLFIAMLGMCMLIADGILTPAISVLSAIDGVRGPFPSVSASVVEALSVIVLLALFLLQKHGTSKVSFLFSPIMATWTLTTPIIGIYSFLRHYPSIFKALSPHYIVYFFLRNRRKGWEWLGGTVLCITGAEAMFADLGHFNKRSIQMAFLFTIYPSLVLTYAGQTAYLIKHLDDHADGFYKFVPQPVYWPVFVIATLAAIVASQSLISATFSVIKQSVGLDYFPRVKVVHTSKHKEGEVYSPETNYILMVLCILVILGFGDGKDIGNAFGVVVIVVMLITTLLLTLVMIIIWRAPIFLVMLYFIPFFIMESVYVSAVFTKIPEGGWFPFLVSIILAFMMFVWYYGRQKKIEYELRNKISIDSFNDLLSSLEVQRVPGLCFFYSNIQDGLTPLLGHYVRNTRSLHKVTIIVTFRYLLVPKVNPQERITIRNYGIEGLYGCIIQYGYADSFIVEGDDYISSVINSLEELIRNSFDGRYSNSPEEEISQLANAKVVGLVHVRGKTRFHVGIQTSLSDRILLGFYEFMHGNCRSALPALAIPLQQIMEIGMLYNT
ncbi:probable potassium transporter 17 [Dendrobium catenatum]|uniref:Potassium transporter n=1 Tax=Dendrobium catenatum TaxID=906689 RepID=A0A2I0WAB5_9ASPA|nr:probable potassium transporter 17 [Dendrobium catenatum]PKU72597.1 putative potassium transporter 17 [Dendrobium catenatum]